jgi:prevent-host-death family protein
MKTVSVSIFKTHCSAVLKEAHTTKEPVLITKRGKPLARLVPAGRPYRRFLGRLRGKIRIVGDIVSPVVPPEDWDALK